MRAVFPCVHPALQATAERLLPLKTALLLFIAFLQQDVLVVPSERPSVPTAYVERIEHVEPHELPHIQMAIIDALSERGHEIRSVDVKLRHADEWVSLPDLLPPQSPPPIRSNEVTVTAGEAPVRGIGSTSVPMGALSGKTVYVSAGHGWYWHSGLGRWERVACPPL